MSHPACPSRFPSGLIMTLGLIAGAACAAPAPGASLCERGQRQSPIDISAPQRRALPPLQANYRPAPLRAVNDGHTVRLRFSGAGGLDEGHERLALQQIHFHTPGGDRLAGEEFPMALHLLHRSRAGQLVPVVVLYRLGAESAALAGLLDHLPGQPGQTQVRPEVPVDPARLLPSRLGYYTYDGSVTDTPCTEGVRWIVLKTPMTLSAPQLARLQRLFPPNARPVQPLNGRVVGESP